MIPFSTLWLYPTPTECRYRPVERRDLRLLAIPAEDFSALTHHYAEISKGSLLRYRIDGRPCRVQTVKTVDGVHFVLRAMTKDIPPLDTLGVPASILNYLLAPKFKGLVLIAGPQGSGKTTLAGALVRERIHRFGGAAQVIEDPPELDLDGVYECGIIQQIDARGGGAEAGVVGFDNAAWLANDALRSDTDILFFGEVRFPREAEIVVSKAAIDALVITTIHASGVNTAVERLVSLSTERWGGSERAAGMVASALSMILHLDLSTQPVMGGKETKVLRIKPLIVVGDSAHGIRAAIQAQRYTELQSTSRLQIAQITNRRNSI
jgi:Tfp pilus assembly pilus retraction ATPase PilT